MKVKKTFFYSKNCRKEKKDIRTDDYQMAKFMGQSIKFFISRTGTDISQNQFGFRPEKSNVK